MVILTRKICGFSGVSSGVGFAHCLYELLDDVEDIVVCGRIETFAQNKHFLGACFYPDSSVLDEKKLMTKSLL
jgi:hypothetical protein